MLEALNSTFVFACYTKAMLKICTLLVNFIYYRTGTILQY
uniref:Uncharacterized protein n=1 Tax=Anguilla anguilla TaxID=7936 RepID=A0A0E9X0G7_ANGAN